MASAVRTLHPDADSHTIRAHLLASAVDVGAIGRDSAYGYGFVTAQDVINSPLRTLSVQAPPSEPRTAARVFPLQGGFGITVPGATHVFIMTDDGLVSAFQDHIGYLWDAGDGPVWVWSYDQHGNVSARTNVARLIRKVKAPVVRVHQRNRKVQVNLLTDITSEEVVSVQVLGKGDRVIKKTRLNATRKDIVFRVTAAERLKVCYLVERKRTGCALVKIPRAAASRASVRR